MQTYYVEATRLTPINKIDAYLHKTCTQKFSGASIGDMLEGFLQVRFEAIRAKQAADTKDAHDTRDNKPNTFTPNTLEPEPGPEPDEPNPSKRSTADTPGHDKPPINPHTISTMSDDLSYLTQNLNTTNHLTNGINIYKPPDVLELLNELYDVIVFRAVVMAAFMCTVADVSLVNDTEAGREVVHFV